MTEDEVFNDDDAPEFDESELFAGEEEFVLDEWDLADEEADSEAIIPEVRPTADSETETLSAEPSPLGFTPTEEDESEELVIIADDEHEMLFGEMTEDRPENLLGESRTFSEDGGATWEGDDTDLADLGMDMVGTGPSGDPTYSASSHDDGMFDMDDAEDLILIDSNEDLEAEFDLAVDLTIDLDEEDESVVFEDAEIHPRTTAEVTLDDVPDDARFEGAFDGKESAMTGDADPASDAGVTDELSFELADESVCNVDFPPAFDTDFDSEIDMDVESEFDAGREEWSGDSAPVQGEVGAVETVDAEFQEFAGGIGADLAATGETVEDFGDEFGDEFGDRTEHDEPSIDYDGRDFASDPEAEDSEWSPVSDFDADEDELSAEDAENDDGYDDGYEGEDEGEDQDYSEYEEAYCDDSQSYAAYADEPRSPLRWIVGIAAALLISAAGAFWYLKTETYTPNATVDAIEVITVPRPDTRVKVEQPNQNTKIVIPTVSIKKDPVPPRKDPVTVPVPPRKDPVAVPPKNDPAVAIPRTDPVPPNGNPVKANPRLDPRDEWPKDEKRVDERLGSSEMLTVGGEDGTAVSEIDEGLMARHGRSVVAEYNGLSMGSKALAQLNNENIFVGRVKALNSSYVTLRTKDGEITLPRADLRALTTLADAEFEALRNMASSGLVRLRNSNRLKGKIVEARDDAVILMVNSNRVIIPNSAIESVSAELQKEVNLDSREVVESDDWFRKLVERKIEKADAEKIGDDQPHTEKSEAPGPGK